MFRYAICKERSPAPEPQDGAAQDMIIAEPSLVRVVFLPPVRLGSVRGVAMERMDSYFGHGLIDRSVSLEVHLTQLWMKVSASRMTAL
jgi:hypothetical protein